MGFFNFFNDKTYNITNLGLTRLVQDDDIVDNIQESTINAILSNRDIPESIRSASLNSLQNIIERYYKNSPDSPDGSFLINSNLTPIDSEIVDYLLNKEGIIKDESGSLGVDVVELSIGKTVSDEFFVFNSMQNMGGFNYELMTFNDNKIDIRTLRKHGNLLKVNILNNGGEEGITGMTFPLPNDNTLKIGIQYIVNGIKNKFLYYNQFQGIDVLDRVISRSKVSEYYPSTLIRDDKVSLHDAYKDDSDFKGRKKAIRLLGIDAIRLSKSIDDSEESKDVEDAMLSFALNVFDESEAVACYFYHFFGLDGEGYHPYTGRNVNYSYIDEDNETVNIRRKEKYWIKLDPSGRNDIHHCWVHEGVELEIVDKPWGDDNASYRMKMVEDDLVIQCRLDDGYHEVNVRELMLDSWSAETSNFIDQSMTRNGLFKLSSTESGEDFSIPLNRQTFKSIPFRFRNEVVYRSMHLSIFSRQEVTVKWYQTRKFMMLVQFISLSIAVVTNGLSSIIAGLTAGVVSAITTIGYMIISAKVVKIMLKLIADTIGDSELGFVVAALFIAYVSSFTGFDGGGIAFSQLNTVDLLNGLAQYSNVLMDNLASEYQDFMGMMSERSDELEALNNELNGGMYQQYAISLSNQYYEYYIENMNIGEKEIESIGQFVEMMTRLPDEKGNFVDMIR